MSTAVSEVLRGRQRRYNVRFVQMCSHFLVQPQACSVAAGWEKGRVEKQIQDVRRRFFTQGARFADMDELNAHLQGACEAHGRRQAHPEYPDRSVYQVFEEERAKLIPYVEDFDSWCQTVASVSKCLLVNFDRNRYSVDVSAAGRQVEVHAYADWLVFRLNGKIVGEHRREFERDRTVYEPLHYLPVLRVKPGALQNGAPFRQWRLPEAMEKVRERLARFEDGDRQMVSKLTGAQQLGWKAVTAACAEALSAGTCHADVVINLARRTVQEEPKTCIDTPSHLALREPPKADCSRYDRWPGVNHGSCR